ncbi:UNKNOWN [Stylonychia lemnae]|uniref:Uncharacterized protein n=1 Tax=Stylonychia lemnae TaxID=5949 RepID=A0A078AKR8_STYLE|nr:UNKNOWN [Stylonychia lemnae]|eukprot:CDW82486.1 UNKNOWN [Stylonychia lemnae]
MKKSLNYQQLIQSESPQTGGIQILMKSYQTIDMLNRKTGVVQTGQIKNEKYIKILDDNSFQRKTDNQMIVPITVTKYMNDTIENQVEGKNPTVIRCIYNKDKVQKQLFRISSQFRMDGKSENHQKYDFSMITDMKLVSIIKEVQQRQKEKQIESMNDLAYRVTLEKFTNTSTTLQSNEGGIMNPRNLLYSLTSKTAYDSFGNYNSIQPSNEIFFAQMRFQEEIDKVFQTNIQFCTTDSRLDEMNIIELKSTNYQSIIEQMNTLVDLLNRILKTNRGFQIQEFVVDFAQDYKDELYYFLQIKYINCVPYISALSPSKQISSNQQQGFKVQQFELNKVKENQSPIKHNKIHYNKNGKDPYECYGDYCDLENLGHIALPRVHQEIIFEILKERTNQKNVKMQSNHFFENLSKANANEINLQSLPIDDAYSYYIIQKTIIKDRQTIKIGNVTRNQLTTLYSRVRVCTSCYCVYKALEKYYFKNLYRQQKQRLKIQKMKQVRNVEFLKFDSDESSDLDTMRRLNNNNTKESKAKDNDMRDKIDQAVLKMFQIMSKQNSNTVSNQISPKHHRRQSSYDNSQKMSQRTVQIQAQIQDTERFTTTNSKPSPQKSKVGLPPLAKQLNARKDSNLDEIREMDNTHRIQLQIQRQKQKIQRKEQRNMSNLLQELRIRPRSVQEGVNYQQDQLPQSTTHSTTLYQNKFISPQIYKTADSSQNDPFDQYNTQEIRNQYIYPQLDQIGRNSLDNIQFEDTQSTLQIQKKPQPLSNSELGKMIKTSYIFNPKQLDRQSFEQCLSHIYVHQYDDMQIIKKRRQMREFQMSNKKRL